MEGVMKKQWQNFYLIRMVATPNVDIYDIFE
jgi:hypothetical protein